jgi:hypothetical protein
LAKHQADGLTTETDINGQQAETLCAGKGAVRQMDKAGEEEQVTTQ